jgi:hypothetical protein
MFSGPFHDFPPAFGAPTIIAPPGTSALIQINANDRSSLPAALVDRGNGRPTHIVTRVSNELGTDLIAATPFHPGASGLGVL